MGHQIAVKHSDQEKLAFFAPDDFKYCFTVMPFGPTNAPTFYTAMMRNFRLEWDELFLATVCNLTLVNGEKVSVSAADEIFIGSSKLVAGSRSIVDDILLWCSHESLVITYFECVCQVFQKYRVSFKLSKCEFLSN